MSREELRRTVPDPAEPPPGWRFAAPDFVGVGAQRSGTSWWHRLVLDHPDVVAPRTLVVSEEDKARNKELHYFDRFEKAPFSPADAEEYARFFPRPPGTLSGEWTPRYMHDHWAPPLILRAAPSTRVIALLRDPVNRYASALTRRRTRRDPSKVPTLGPGIASSALSRGLFHEQLSRLLRHFDRSRLLVLQYERCTAAPHEELRRTYGFLGLDRTDHVPEELISGGKEQARWDMHPELRRELVARLEADVAALARDFPELDLGLWESFRHLAASPPRSA